VIGSLQSKLLLGVNEQVPVTNAIVANCCPWPAAWLVSVGVLFVRIRLGRFDFLRDANRAARYVRNHPVRVVRIGLVLGYPNKARAIVEFARPLAAIGIAGGHARLIGVVAGEAKHQDVFDQFKLELQRGQLALEA